MSTTAHAIDLDDLAAAVELLTESVRDSILDGSPKLATHLRDLQLAHKALWEVEKRNLAVAAREKESGEQWTRLDTMAPFHPDDWKRMGENADRLREIVLEEGRRQEREKTQP